MNTIRLKNGHDQRVRAGHPWIFSNEIADDVSRLEPGGVVDVCDAAGRFLGRGYANPASLISVRLLTRDSADDIDSAEFYANRIKAALRLRDAVVPGRRAYRLIASEADFLPGLVIDRFDDVLAVQIHTLGMERRADLVRAALVETLAPVGVALRNDASVRLLEGLSQESRLWWGEVPERVPFVAGAVNGRALTLYADVLGGQKTGFFFDQAENRAFAAARSAGMRVLDVYANTGAWAVGAMLGGAEDALAIEVNPRTVELIEANAALNGLTVRTVAADAREHMATLARGGERFDAVFLDPPAFAKNRKKAGVALHAYRDVNRAAMTLLRPGGLLYTSSCSFHILEERFAFEVQAAARQCGRQLRQVRRGEQAPDHPVLPAIPESRYLKHHVYQVL